jgi:phage repressor protein C with HTH and peptisase S24 domain
MDDTMELRYSKGDIVYINPSQPVRQGNSALIELTDGSARIGRVAAIDGEGNVTLQFLNVADSDHFKEYPASQVKNIHRIVGALEV